MKSIMKFLFALGGIAQLALGLASSIKCTQVVREIKFDSWGQKPLGPPSSPLTTSKKRKKKNKFLSKCVGKLFLDGVCFKI